MGIAIGIVEKHSDKLGDYIDLLKAVIGLRVCPLGVLLLTHNAQHCTIVYRTIIMYCSMWSCDCI